MDNKVKVIIAVVILGLAGLVLAMQLGLFSSTPKGADNPEGFDEAVEQALTNTGSEEPAPIVEDPAGRSGRVGTGTRMMPE